MNEAPETTVMREIVSLDRDASVHWSSITGKWYVSSKLGTTGNGLVSSITEHRDSAPDALVAFRARLREHIFGSDKVLTLDSDPRRAWQWSPEGKTWIEVRSA